MLRKVLLVSGILSSLLYAAMTVIIAMQGEGYSSASQVISELSAIGAPTRWLWLLPGAVYTVLVTAFGWGVWKSADRNRSLRIVGGLIIAYGSLGILWPFAPMHLREAVAAGGSTLSDTMHVVLSSVTVFLMLLAIGCGAAALGKRFRLYSVATLVILLAFGGLTFWEAPRLAANLPTPWIGVWERINVGVFLLWVVVLATALLRARGTGAITACVDIVAPHAVEGHVSRGFETVREAFADNFARRRELGGACCAYQRGEKVVDLWGGIRNKQSGEPWEQNTMVVVHSATKGLAAMTLAIAHSRGWLDYDERVCAYWPEFAQQGKERITVRQLLAHQAGLFAINEPVDRSILADLDRLAVVLARQKPAWEPGTRQAYHALTLGFYEGELLRRVDPRHRSLGQFFQDEIASPLGLDLYLRLPDAIPNSRLATIAPPGRMEMLLRFPFRFTLEAMNPRSNIYRALVINPGTAVYLDEQRVYARNLEVPSGNAVGTARAIACAYSVFATGGRELGLRRETLDLLAAPAIPPTRGCYDECLKAEVQFSLGFMKPSAVWPFGSPSSFGAPGSGGSLGFADPATGVGYAYVTSQMGTTLTGDPRDVALGEALYSALPRASSGVSPVAA
jgi:CubicO group peptidase (beta-lactamase class C family)